MLFHCGGYSHFSISPTARLTAYSHLCNKAGVFINRSENSDSDAKHVSVMGRCDGATIQNITFSDVDITNSGSTCCNGYSASGFVGNAQDSVFSRVSIDGTIAATCQCVLAGALAFGFGRNIQDSTITDCHVNASIVARQEGADGNGAYVAGFTDVLAGCTVERSSFSGQLEADAINGERVRFYGFARYIDLSYQYEQGSVVRESWVNATLQTPMLGPTWIDMYGFTDMIRGAEGEDTLVEDCYSICDVSGGTTESAGFAGTVLTAGASTLGNHATVRRCYSMGSVNTGASLYGGFSAEEGGLPGSSVTVEDCFFDSEVAGTTSTAHGTPLTTAEMKTQSAFTDADWDFTNVWDMDGVKNDGYPFLRVGSAGNQPPSILTGYASKVNRSTATLSGYLTSLGSANSVDVCFEYWPEGSSFTQTTSAITITQEDYQNDGISLLGISYYKYSLPISSLSSDTTYHFQAVAVGDGTVFGDPQTFKTKEDTTWSFAIIADLHIGEGYDDFAGARWYDAGTTEADNNEIPLGQPDPRPVDYLLTAVDEIISNKAQYNIQFVAVLGDITQSAELSEMARAKGILNKLNANGIPWIPITGNHDIWPYTKNEDAPETYEDSNGFAIGTDAYFHEVFNDVYEGNDDYDYEGLRSKLNNFERANEDKRCPEDTLFRVWNDQTQTWALWDKEAKDNYSFLQNFYFEKNGYHFFCLDFNARESLFDSDNLLSDWLGDWVTRWVPDYMSDEVIEWIVTEYKVDNKGVSGQGVLHDFFGDHLDDEPCLAPDKSNARQGTWKWFMEKMDDIPKNELEKVIILSHHTFEAPFMEHVMDQITGFDDKDKIRNDLDNYANQLNIQFGGHHHPWDAWENGYESVDIPVYLENGSITRNFKDKDGELILKSVAVTENKTGPWVTLVQFSGDDIDYSTYLPHNALSMKGLCPVDLVVTDPDGLIISKQQNDVPGSLYNEGDYNGDGEKEDDIWIRDRKQGIYTIQVVPEAGASPTDTYTLIVSPMEQGMGYTPIFLAENVPISEIPAEGYTFRVRNRIKTNLTFIQDGSEQCSNPITLGAILTDVFGNPLPDKTIKFQIGFEIVEATTGTDGIAAASLTIDEIATYDDIMPELYASFTGDSAFLPSQDVSEFTELPFVDAGPSVITINEGEEAHFTGSFTDSCSNTHTINWNFGDGTTASGALTTSHIYTDNGVYYVILKVTNEYGRTSYDFVTVHVMNVAPALDEIIAPVEPTQIDTQITARADFTDPGVLDTHTAIWDWGDGTTSEGVITEMDGAGTVTGDHTYEAAGVYTVILTVEDDEGGTATAEFRYAVIYDPEGGFVTGGGWIDSPEGAYAAAPTLTGKANFGFVSKYKKGQSTPEGNTQFQFQAGDLNFHSGTYEWMVIAHHKAMYKGTGTINGQGNYGFMLSAIDEDLTPSTDTDLFRIKIWDKDNGDVIVYDNQMGAEEDADPTTAIGGGNIKIHN